MLTITIVPGWKPEHQHWCTWHKYHFNPEDTLLGKSACKVTSMTLWIGSTEQIWTKMKRLISSDRSNIHIEVAHKQDTITGHHTQENNKQKHSTKATGRLLWGSTLIQFASPLMLPQKWKIGKWLHESSVLGSRCGIVTCQKKWRPSTWEMLQEQEQVLQSILELSWYPKVTSTAYILSGFFAIEKVSIRRKTCMTPCFQRCDNTISKDDYRDKQWKVWYCGLLFIVLWNITGSTLIYFLSMMEKIIKTDLRSNYWLYLI